MSMTGELYLTPDVYGVSHFVFRPLFGMVMQAAYK